MIKVHATPDSNIVEMVVEGSATAEEFDTALQTLNASIETHGTIKLLEHIGDLSMPPIPWSRFWEDIKFGFGHLSDITHVAVVADQGWIGTWVQLMNPLFKAEMKVFTRADIAKARAWLKETS